MLKEMPLTPPVKAVLQININKAIKSNNLKSKLLLQVHDELVFDLYNDEQKVMLSLVKKNMQEAVVLDVPLDVELGIANNWLEAH